MYRTRKKHLIAFPIPVTHECLRESKKAVENSGNAKSKVVLRKKISAKESSDGNGTTGDKSKGSVLEPKDNYSRNAEAGVNGDKIKTKTSSTKNEELKKEKDKSSKRKSNLNRALTEEAAPVPEYMIEADPAVRRRSRTLSRPVSQEVSSLDSSSHDEPIASKESPGIVKPPQIPQIFQNSVDNKFIKSPPPSSTKIISTKIKVFESSPKSGKSSAKKDSASDAEGISSIKRLLQRESKKNPSADSNLPRKSVTPAVFSNADPAPVIGVKKSPSASAFNWSKLSNTQPSFLRKFFEKDPKEKELKESTEVPKTEISKTEDEVLALNVAQKANFFMKLEHEQRFSKWRRGTDTPIINTSIEEVEARPKNRFATQPVKTEDVELAQKIRNSRQTPALKLKLDKDQFPDENSGGVLGNSNCPEIMIAETVGGVAWSAKSSYTDRDDAFPTQPVYQTPGPEPSSLSLKDRVIMFDRIQSRADSRPPSAMKSKPFGFPPPKSFTYGSSFGTFPTQTPIRTPFDYSNMENDRRSVFEEFSTPIGWLPPGTPYRNPDVLSPLSMAKRRGSTSDVELNTLRQMAQQGQFGPGFPPLFPGFKHCPPPPPPPMNIPNRNQQGHAQVKNIRVKSMFLTSGGSDAETYSEDGEVSSGGQEVAEIISRSYENSPM
ncbi:unnamed protein product [Allacma fusca]|uniref:Uncharacterized protein n=1 Tax=Allacma fusca TaxID=39272 RepID=A0A8J2PBV9_9HEXA|nr:unnamed protein product [Allacma fusca]